MSEQDLTPTMQEMMAQMARMQAELDNLKQRAHALPQIEEPTSLTPVSTITSTLFWLLSSSELRCPILHLKIT